MLVLITYDLNTETAAGKKCLRKQYKTKVESIGVERGKAVDEVLIL